ncbi:thioester domain-containing protein [Saccharothrix sp. NPDC042600]|uniref:thioester domain-containing protein n=1 Tax=Saccharothrix TaxID=2071 RepID=UPI0033FA86C7|nr:thioester domain-containing protein [Saccharothrix mutabilis subsp. capreolus]
MAPRLTLKRVGAAVLGASLFALTTALPAVAEAVEVKPHPSADIQGMGVHLQKKKADGKLEDYEGGKPVNTELIGLLIKEGGEKDTAVAYCVELPTGLEDGTPLIEAPWGDHPNPDSTFPENAAQVNWILHHSYPKLPYKDVAKELGAEGAKESSVIAATQAAIWHFTDGVVLKESDPTVEPDDVDADVLAMYKKLTENNPGLDQEPNPTLKIDPKELEGKAGTLIGPFVISTTTVKGTIEANLPTGVTFTDKDGKELAVAANGDFRAASQVNIAEVYVKVAEGVAPGEVEFTVRATAELQHGRLFVGKDGKKTQSLVIAKPTPASVKDTAKVKWVENVKPTTPSETTTTTTTTTTAPTTTTTPAPAAGGGDDDLASTGASIFVPLLIGLGLLGAGAAALIIVRRKKTA